jgi:hypothetical protein
LTGGAFSLYLSDNTVERYRSHGEQIINNSGVLAVFEDAQEVVADTHPCFAAVAGRADNLCRKLGPFALALYLLLIDAQVLFEFAGD